MAQDAKRRFSLGSAPTNSPKKKAGGERIFPKGTFRQNFGSSYALNIRLGRKVSLSLKNTNSMSTKIAGVIAEPNFVINPIILNAKGWASG